MQQGRKVCRLPVDPDSTRVKLIALSKAFIQRTYRHEKFELTDAISLSLSLSRLYLFAITMPTK